MPITPYGPGGLRRSDVTQPGDGLAVAAGFGASTSLGLVAAFAVIVHEFPEGLSIAAIALGAGYGRRQAFLLSLVVALATPLGAIVACRGIQGPGDPLLALLLGVSAGSFLYVAATDLLPQLHREQDGSVFALFVVGLGLMILSKAYPLG